MRSLNRSSKDIAELLFNDSSIRVPKDIYNQMRRIGLPVRQAAPTIGSVVSDILGIRIDEQDKDATYLQRFNQDKFATSVPDGECHCVDMEAYALAKVCLSFGVKFKCIKFISDIVGEGDQATEWENNKANGVGMFEQSLKQLIGE